MTVAERTYALKGQGRVDVNENVSMSRARFTAMTMVRSWDDGTIPKLAVLFRLGKEHPPVHKDGGGIIDKDCSDCSDGGSAHGAAPSQPATSRAASASSAGKATAAKDPKGKVQRPDAPMKRPAAAASSQNAAAAQPKKPRRLSAEAIVGELQSGKPHCLVQKAPSP